jgi:hypothetical protein
MRGIKIRFPLAVQVKQTGVMACQPRGSYGPLSAEEVDVSMVATLDILYARSVGFHVMIPPQTLWISDAFFFTS